ELILEFLSTLRFGETWHPYHHVSKDTHFLDTKVLSILMQILLTSRRVLVRRSQETIELEAVYFGLRLHTREDMESLSFARDLVLRLCHRMMAYNIAGSSQAPEKVTMIDLFYLRGLDVRSVSIPYLLARYLRRFATGMKSMAHIFGGQFVAQLAENFGLMTAKILGGLTVIAPK
nr:hypothetical protein [Tanacetum cinerariifolium]